MPSDMADDLTPLFNNPRDARRFQLKAMAVLMLLYGHLAAVILGWAPAWSLFISAPILVVRWLLGTHELLHLRTEREVDALTRLMPLLLTPLSIGYREHLAMHRGHHQSMATPDDPEYFQLRGNKLAGFLNALTAPEQSFLRWIAAHGADAELLVGAAIRLGLFATLAWLSGPWFLWYWIPVRLSHALAFFSFFYLLHRRGREYGVYPVKLPNWAARTYALLFGREALLATCHHDAHHRHPRVSALHLPDIA